MNDANSGQSLSGHPDLLVKLGTDHVASIIIDCGPDNYIDVELATDRTNESKSGKAVSADELGLGMRKLFNTFPQGLVINN